MKTSVCRTLIVVGISALMAAGCASRGAKNHSFRTIGAGPITKLYGPPWPPGVTLREDKDVQGVWLAPGFNFKGFDTLVINDIRFQAVVRTNETEIRAVAMRVLRDELVGVVQKTGLFQTVRTATANPPGIHDLVMSNTIIEYEKGSGGARFFAGLYGGGQPIIRVRGEIRDSNSLLCVYEIRRSGDSAGSRIAGEFMSDEAIQRDDIRDLVIDLADFFKRVAAQ